MPEDRNKDKTSPPCPAKRFSVEITDFRGAQKVALGFDSRLIVSGGNAAGKTSVADAIRRAFSWNAPLPRYAKDYGYNGGEFFVKARMGDSEVVMTREGIRGYEPWADAVAVGHEAILDMRPRDRLTHLMRIANNQPINFLKDYCEKQVHGEEVFTIIQDKMQDMQVWNPTASADFRTWDLVGSKLYDDAARLKRQFMQVTGEMWGNVKGANWEPDGYEQVLDGHKSADLRALWEAERRRLLTIDERIDECFRLRAETATRRGLLETEYWGVLSDVAFYVDGKKNDHFMTKTRIEELVAMRKEKQAQYHLELGKRGTWDEAMKCPHCEGEAWLTSGALTAMPPTIDAMPLNEADIENNLRELDQQIDEFESAYEKSRWKFLAMREAEKTISMLTDRITALQDEREKSNLPPFIGNVTKCGVAVLALEKREKAKELHEQIVLAEAARKAVGPEGFRLLALKHLLEGINKELRGVATSLWTTRKQDLADLHINDDGRVYFGHYPMGASEDGNVRTVSHLSESEQWLVNLAFQVVLARRTESKLIVVDRADMLDSQRATALLERLDKALGDEIAVAVMLTETGNHFHKWRLANADKWKYYEIAGGQAGE